MAKRTIKKFGQITDELPGKVKKGTNNIRFVARNNIPVGCTVTYSCIVVDARTHKE